MLILCRYAAIVVDEAHERSINTDVILGLLKRDARKYPNLKICVTSATIETQLFRDFFGEAACLNVPGRMYPVLVKHMPIPDSQDLSQPVVSAVLSILEETSIAAEAAAVGAADAAQGNFGEGDEEEEAPQRGQQKGNLGGDVLVFMTGQVHQSTYACPCFIALQA